MLDDPILPPPLPSRATIQAQATNNGDATNRQLWVWLAAIAVFVVIFYVAYSVLKPGSSSLSESEPPHPASVIPDQNKTGQIDRPARSPLPADELFALCSPSVVQIVIQDPRGRTIGTGSGFLVGGQDLIATNYHVIEKAYSSHVVLADNTKVSVLGVVQYRKLEDIAIVKLARQVNARPLELAGNKLPLVGAKVFAIGNPQGLANTLSDGLVSGHRENEGLGITEIQTSAPISPGSSGGPLLTADGRVVGVTSSGLRNGQNLNFAVPVEVVSSILAACNGQSELTPFPLSRFPAEFAIYNSGNSWFNQEEYDKAIEEFDEAIRLHPEFAIAFIRRGQAWYMKGNLNEAIKDYDKGISLDPTQASDYALRGVAWLGKKVYDKAIKDFDKAIQLDPSHAEYYARRAYLRLQTKAYDEAIKDCNEAIRRNPNLAFPFSVRGLAWSAKKEPHKADKDFDEARRLDPKLYK